MILNGAKYTWRIEAADPELAVRMGEDAGVSSHFASVLLSRGMTDGREAERVLRPEEQSLPDARLLPDADRVVARVMEAISKGELVAVHGHDDADGVTATVIMVEALQQLGASVVSYIPDRKTEGHGFSRAEYERHAAAGVSLVITVDSCVSDREFISFGNGLGVDTIVTDHHEIPPELPPAAAIVNPKLPDSGFPYRYMAGVGVSLRVADLLLDELSGKFGPAAGGPAWFGPRWRDEALALAAIGSIADKVPLTGDNRIIVAQGLVAIPRTARTGLRAALEEGRIWGGDVEQQDVRQSLGALLGRAPGDEPGTQLPLTLLMMQDLERARSLAKTLFAAQGEWKARAADAWRSVRERLESRGSAAEGPVDILEAEVPIGVVGYVTSRLTDETGRPTILITPKRGEVAAEARGPAGFNFVDAFATMRELFIGYGGHPRAAGFSMSPENVDAFRERMLAFAQDNPPAPLPRLVDAELQLSDVTLGLASELERMKPFGQGNRRALLFARGVTGSEAADAEEHGVRFGTPVTFGERPVDVVYGLRESDGVPLVTVKDTIDGVSSGGRPRG